LGLRPEVGRSLPRPAGDELPRFREVRAKFIVADLSKLDSYPALDANVRRPVVDRRTARNQGLLFAWLGGYDNRDVAVVMVIAREHRKNAFLHEERRLTVGELFGYTRQRQADSADSLQLLLTIHALSPHNY